MTGHVYKITELVGSSPNSIQEAIENAVHEAAQSLRHIRWFEVTDTRGHVEDGVVAHWQVTVRLGFTMETVE
ncbi:dodecin [Spectribacter hydrogenoxidans]|uniref:Dodecin family protein n=1 Tax=Spectribacter hydrogenoxidans TaxID=3075608 RepID=A0ABU3BZT7_9GAMM|nr:dodecin [Salinisphaera sp. W335]MDT0634832.1 dodecin family protein [Salinisphaera sp. W335]